MTQGSLRGHGHLAVMAHLQAGPSSGVLELGEDASGGQRSIYRLTNQACALSDVISC